MTDNRFTRISDAEFEAALRAAPVQRERDYRKVSGPLIQFAMTDQPGAGKVTHMRYIGGNWPGAVRCN